MFNWIKDFFSNRQEAKFEKYKAVISKRKAMREDRIAALEFFSDLSDPNEAVPALLRRFEYSLEHGINDSREKEIARQGILQHGEAAVPFLKEYLVKTDRIAWPIKILAEICSPDQLADLYFENLHFEDVSLNQAIVNKNFDLLTYLSEVKVSPDRQEKLISFLQDPDERVRYAAVEVFLAQDDHPESVKRALEPFILDTSSENRRLRTKVIQLFVQEKWKVSNAKDFPKEPIVDGIILSKDGIITRID